MPRPHPLPPVLYEDDALIAFAKPAGLLIAPDRWDRDRACLMHLIHELLSPEIFNAHRLDRETSGVLLCAKDRSALRALVAAFAARAVVKTYFALASAAPAAAEGLVDTPLAPDPRRPGRMRAGAPGERGTRPSETAWRVRERWRGGWTLVEARPRTGRTHQVRVHLALAGAPVAGDPLYGDGRELLLSRIKRGYKPGREPERPLVARLALHAAALALPHPVSGEPLVIEAPLPDDLALALKALRRHAA